MTIGQYTTFLNAVAATDTYGLYSSLMATDYPTIKVIRIGTSGNYTYSVGGTYSQAANCPIFEVSWGDAVRFCNWLQNGQPTGPEGIGTTETGAYTLNGEVTDSALGTVTRNAGAKYVLPTEDEWYKAAYYKGGGANAGYWTYPTQSNTVPSNTLSPTGTNNANFYTYPPGKYTDPTNELTPVGYFGGSPGYYGTFDMGGNVGEWNETAVPPGSLRGLRGAAWVINAFPNAIGSYYRFAPSPTLEDYATGFRVASVPEPGSLAMLAGVALAALLCWWRKRA